MVQWRTQSVVIVPWRGAKKFGRARAYSGKAAFGVIGYQYARLEAKRFREITNIFLRRRVGRIENRTSAQQGGALLFWTVIHPSPVVFRSKNHHHRAARTRGSREGIQNTACTTNDWPDSAERCMHHDDVARTHAEIAQVANQRMRCSGYRIFHAAHISRAIALSLMVEARRQTFSIDAGMDSNRQASARRIARPRCRIQSPAPTAGRRNS